MLRMTTLESDDQTALFRLEGRIIGSWVDELRRECQEPLSHRKRIILDVSQVSFADEKGVLALKKLIGNQVQLVGCSLFLSELLNSI